jgi:hypothetical protein
MKQSDGDTRGQVQYTVDEAKEFPDGFRLISGAPVDSDRATEQ